MNKQIKKMSIIDLLHITNNFMIKKMNIKKKKILKYKQILNKLIMKMYKKTLEKLYLVKEYQYQVIRVIFHSIEIP